MLRSILLVSMMSLLTLLFVACDDGDGNEANRLGVGAACASNANCTEVNQSCLLQFKGGYCGVANCVVDADCPQGSACVTHDDGSNYCFLLCTDKAQCNANRPADSESNCSSSVTFAEGAKTSKACVPPSN
ncbi:MAG: hypothetical protein AUK47_07480 [Deltaproteobacteria bacterium CG2_30_63_29]|nr:MAG: hypothetical protein AUK47_07480 [Deltaproteobacteria bacterium CG2_30_63_29]